MRALSISLFLFVFCLTSCINLSNTFELKGEISGYNDSTEIILSYLIQKDNVWIELNDTAYLLNEKFVFKGNIDELTAAYLSFNNDYIRLYLEPCKIKLKISKERPFDYQLIGTRVEDENIKLRNKLLTNEEKLNILLKEALKIIDEINSHNENLYLQDSLTILLRQNSIKRINIAEKMTKIRQSYIRENNNNVNKKIVPDLIYLMAKEMSVNIDTIKYFYDNLSDKTKISPLGKIAFKQIEQYERSLNGKNIKVGSYAPDFSAKDVSGKLIKLSDYYNNNSYILLDFWASWCKPCIEQIPNLQKLHSNYITSNFSIIGISSDDNTVNWKNTIIKYRLEKWPQIISKVNNDKNYFAEDISEMYGVETIPTYFLINQRGQIISKWTHIDNDIITTIEHLLKKEQQVIEILK